MNGFTRTLSLGTCACLASVALGASKDEIGFGVKVGYYTGQSFDGIGGQRIRLQGPELGFDIPLQRLGQRATLRFSPSMMLGGALASGSDSDGNIYRMLLAVEFRQPGETTYWIAGAGFGFAHDRGITRIRNKSGFVAQVGYGMDLAGRFQGGRPYAEFSVYAGSATFQGLGLNLGLRF